MSLVPLARIFGLAFPSGSDQLFTRSGFTFIFSLVNRESLFGFHLNNLKVQGTNKIGGAG